MEIDFERKNVTKTKFYNVFYKLVEPTVIDMVLEGCCYEETESYQKLSEMCSHAAPPLNNAPINPAGSAHDPVADNQRSPPESILGQHAHGQNYQQAHVPRADNQRSPPSLRGSPHGVAIQAPLQNDLFVNNQRASPPPFLSVAERSRQFEHYQQVGFQRPSAPVMSLPPPYQTNPPVYVPKELNDPMAPAFGQPDRISMQHAQVNRTFINDDNDDDAFDGALDLFVKLQVLRHIVDSVQNKRTKTPTDVKNNEILKENEKRGEASKLSIKGFPKNWPRNDHGATIIPVKGDVRTKIATSFKAIDQQGIKVEIQAIEELCNFNLYEEFIVQKHCIEEQKKSLNERQLWFYARPKDVENICYQGIDFQHNLSNGPNGTGKYFFTTPKEAHDKKGAKKMTIDDMAYMFLCDVNTGRMIKGKRGNDFVPLDEEGTPYESSVNSLTNPTMFVLHDKKNCYPRYMVTYKIKPEQ